MSDSVMPASKKISLHDNQTLDIFYLECEHCRRKRTHAKPLPAIMGTALAVAIISLYLKIHFGDQEYGIQVMLIATVLVAGRLFLYKYIYSITEIYARRKHHEAIKAKQSCLTRKAQDLIVGHDRLVHLVMGNNGWLNIRNRASAAMVPALETFLYAQRHNLSADEHAILLSYISKTRRLHRDTENDIDYLKQLMSSWRNILANLYCIGVKADAKTTGQESDMGEVLDLSACLAHERILAGLESHFFDERPLREITIRLVSRDGVGYTKLAEVDAEYALLKEACEHSSVYFNRLVNLLEEAHDTPRKTS